ncbi:MAG: type II secretion system F family protein [Rhodoferax sp.]|nr:type II secretion system F family protein [Pseudorhodobacter sp.]
MSDFFAGIDPGWLIFIGVFLGALLLIEGMRQLASRRETDGEARSRRMRLIAGGTQIEERLEILLPGDGSQKRFLGMDLGSMLVASGLPQQPMIFGLGALVLFCLASLVLKPLVGTFVAIGLSLMVFILLPLMVMSVIKTARLKRISAQLPDALDLMARALRAGHPLSSSIGTVAETMPDPIGTEFGIVVDQISYGDELVVAFRKLAERNPSEDFHYLAVSIAIQHGTGGNLGRVLGVLAGVMRGRIMMRRKIKSMSAEGRISAWILSGLPFLMVGLNSIITPSYYGDVVQDPLFMPMTLVTLGFIFLNGFVLFRLVNFRI